MFNLQYPALSQVIFVGFSWLIARQSLSTVKHTQNSLPAPPPCRVSKTQLPQQSKHKNPLNSSRTLFKEWQGCLQDHHLLAVYTNSTVLWSLCRQYQLLV
ncbi:hypothetical protein MRX96_033708 [Rhipicephalus microplus]